MVSQFPKILNDFLANFNIFAYRDISVSRLGHPLIGTASADKTARIWGKFKYFSNALFFHLSNRISGVDSGRCLTAYVGHTGSVNSIAFHPTQDLVLFVPTYSRLIPP